MNKADLLAEVRAQNAEWEELVASIPPERLTEPGLPGGWSVKDVFAHIAWGQREAVGLVKARALVGSALWRLSEDERNAAVHEQNRHRALDDVLTDSREVFAAYLAALESLNEDELADAAHFEGMPADWKPWRVLHDPHHYPGHAEDVRRWKSSIEKPSGSRA